RPAVTITALTALAPSSDPGDTLATALAVGLPINSSVTVSQAIGDNAYGAKDVDLYKLSGAAGDVLEADLVDKNVAPYPYVRVFDAAGNQLAVGYYYSAAPTVRLTLPAAGTYYVGVSSYPNGSYDPNTANSGSAS